MPRNELTGVPVSTERSSPPPPGDPWVTTESDPHGVRAHLTGDLDCATGDDLAGLVGQLLDAGHRRLVLDLTELAFCDARGLTALLTADRTVHAMGGSLTVTGVPTQVGELLQMTGLGDAFGPR